MPSVFEQFAKLHDRLKQIIDKESDADAANASILRVAEQIGRTCAQRPALTEFLASSSGPIYQSLQRETGNIVVDQAQWAMAADMIISALAHQFPDRLSRLKGGHRVTISPRGASRPAGVSGGLCIVTPTATGPLLTLAMPEAQWWQDRAAYYAEACSLLAELTAPAGQHVPSNQRKRRQKTRRDLTAKQLEAVEAFGKRESNYSKTAGDLGLSITATKDRIQAAYKKLGAQVPTKAKTQALTLDRRGGVPIARGAKPEARGDGKARSGDRRLD